MSGGHFDYTQFHIGQIAEQVEDLIRVNDSTEVNEYGDMIGRHYSPETIREFKAGLIRLQEAAIYAQRIDWLVSCDDGEEQFHSRLAEDLQQLKERNNEQ